MDLIRHEEAIEALQKLLELHVKNLKEQDDFVTFKRKHSIKCPLCEVFMTDETGSAGRSPINCKECPWMQITDDVCSSEQYTSSILRIKEIIDWIELYKKDLAENEKEQHKPIMLLVESYDQMMLYYAVANIGSVGLKKIMDIFNNDKVFYQTRTHRFSDRYVGATRMKEYNNVLKAIQAMAMTKSK